MTKRVMGLSAMGLLFLVVGWIGLAGPVDAATCPAAAIGTVCAQWDEPTGVTNLRDTMITISRDATALPAVTIPASSPTGGVVQSTTISTIGCVSDTYTATAVSRYNTPLGIMSSLVVSATPGAGLTKDRTGEAACLLPVTNFTIR